MKVYRICFLFSVFPFSPFVQSHVSQKKNYPLEPNIVQWSKYFKMHILKENIKQAVNAKVLTLIWCYTLERKVEMWYTQKLMFIWLKFFHFSPIEILKGNFSFSDYSFFHYLMSLTVSLPNNVDTVCKYLEVKRQPRKPNIKMFNLDIVIVYPIIWWGY